MAVPFVSSLWHCGSNWKSYLGWKPRGKGEDAGAEKVQGEEEHPVVLHQKGWYRARGVRLGEKLEHLNLAQQTPLSSFVKLA